MLSLNVSNLWGYPNTFILWSCKKASLHGYSLPLHFHPIQISQLVHKKAGRKFCVLEQVITCPSRLIWLLLTFNSCNSWHSRDSPLVMKAHPYHSIANLHGALWNFLFHENFVYIHFYSPKCIVCILELKYGVHFHPNTTYGMTKHIKPNIVYIVAEK